MMNRMKIGIIALVIGALAVTAVAVAAQSPGGAQPPAQGQGQGQAPAQGQGFDRGRGQLLGLGGELQTIADALGIDAATLRSDLQSGKTIADIAKDKNVEISAIADAVVAKRQETLTAAVTDGRLTQAQADAQITLLKANLDALFNRTFEIPQTNGGQPGFAQRSNPMLDVIAKALGVDASTLQTDLRSGKTIADIAKDKSVELSAVVDAVVAERQTAITAAVTDGRLTQEQADAQIALLKANLNAAFSKQFDGRGFNLFGFGGFGQGQMGGMNGSGNGGRGGFGQRGNNGPMGNGGNGPMGNGNNGPMGNGGNGPMGNNPPTPEATPEATSTANA